MYKREQRWELKYVSLKDGSVKHCYPRSEERKNEQLAVCKKKGIKVISCKKLYPFSTEKNQHNFMLISNICSNRIHDMHMGDIEYDDAEIERLEGLKDKADKYFTYELPVAWVTWEEHQEMKELSMMAVNHRIDCCIESGHPELVQYC